MSVRESSLRQVGWIDLPEHAGSGGFDHAAVHGSRRLLYIAHTANDAIDVVDLKNDRYARAVSNLKGVAGALVDEGKDLVFTSNRGEDTVSVFTPDRESEAFKVRVGSKPNGLAYDPARDLLLAANVGVSSDGSYTVSIVDVGKRSLLAEIPVPGRTRWVVFDPRQSVFFVNIADPAQIAVIESTTPGQNARTITIPARGPHGLDLDADRNRLYCACDEGIVVSLDCRSGDVVGTLPITGSPDVVFLNRHLGRLYVAIGDPGVIDVIDVEAWRIVETIVTEPGAHTIAFDDETSRVYAFLPISHRAAVYQDER